MLEIKKLSIRRGPREVLTIDQLSLAPGQATAIVGPNGAGKSTLLLALAGLLQPSHGEILLDGKPLNDWPLRELAQRRAYLAQQFSLNAAFSVTDVVALGRSPHKTPREQDQHCIDSALQAVGLADFGDRAYPRLSGGEQQRVHLARVLAQLDWGLENSSSRWALLDEPTASLDLGRRTDVLKTCRALTKQGVGVIAVLHDLNLAWRHFDQVCLLDQGLLIQHGPPAEVLTLNKLQSAYATELMLIKDAQGGHWIAEKN